MSPRDNERLEYLGDAVLQLITAEYLYKHHPGAAEGELTQTRSAMVNTNTLAQLAEQLDLGSYLYLGKGIAKGGGRSLKSLLANAFEAVLGAVFLDAGYDAAYHYYLNRYRALESPVRDENFKGRLQQVAQERFGTTPFYDSEGARVGAHREYTSVVLASSAPPRHPHRPSRPPRHPGPARDGRPERPERRLRPKPGPRPQPWPRSSPFPSTTRTPSVSRNRRLSTAHPGAASSASPSNSPFPHLVPGPELTPTSATMAGNCSSAR